MARRNVFDRAREFIAGTSRRVLDAVSEFFERSNDPIDHESVNETIDFEVGSGDTNQSDHNETDTISDETLAELIESDNQPTQTFPPEQPPEDGDPDDEEYESEFEFEFGSFGLYDPRDLRRVLVTFEEAVSYARDITLPPEDISIIKDRDTGLYRVLVDYEVLLSE